MVSNSRVVVENRVCGGREWAGTPCLLELMRVVKAAVTGAKLSIDKESTGWEAQYRVVRW